MIEANFDTSLKLVLVAAILVQFVSYTYAMEEWRSWNSDELNRQMSPSQWNPNKTADVVIQEFINTGIDDTKKAIDTLKHELEIPYGQRAAEKMDIYGTDLGDDSPILVFIHGGYWQEGSKNISGGFAVINYRNGFRTAAIGYTLAPEAKIKTIQEEIVRAVKFITTKYPKAKLILAGHSAGGQLVSHFIHHSHPDLSKNHINQIIGMVLISGVFDLRPLVNTYVNDPLKMDMKEAESLSALITSDINSLINREGLNIFIIVGKYDSPEFQRQAQDYYDKLRKIFPRTKYWKSESDDHFTIVQNMVHENTLCAKQVQEFLKGCISEKNSGSGGSVFNPLPYIFTLLSLFIKLI